MSTDKKIQLGVIFGGRSGEHEVSLASARSVLTALDHDKYLITEIGISKQGEWFVGEDILDILKVGTLEDLTPAALLPIPKDSALYTMQAHETGKMLHVLTKLDVVFPVLHGTFGEDGTLQGLLEMADLAYVGAGVLGSSVGMDKGVFKDVMVANDIPVVDAELVLRREIEHDIDAVVGRVEKLLSYPVFVKPANMGSSVGVHKCSNAGDLREGLRDAARYDRRILVERGVNAREIELSVLGNDTPRVSIPGEIRPKAEFYSYEAKYHDDDSELLIPAPISEEEVASLQALAVRAYQAIDCAGMARADFMIDKDTGNIYLNEVNTIPGFTPISMYPKLWSASGLAYADLIDELIALALERRADRDKTEWGFVF